MANGVLMMLIVSKIATNALMELLPLHMNKILMKELNL